jgi:acetyltransferase-like isoleucine patch superfamily enzyme
MDNSGDIAMTPQQREFSRGSDISALQSYKHVMVGEAGWLPFSAFELYCLFFGGMESILGIGARRLLLPLFLRSCGRGPVIGHGVTIRQPGRISFGKKVILDDFSLVDVRTRPGQDQDAAVEIGDYSYVGRYSIVSAKYGRIKLGRACNIGSYSRIATREDVIIGDSVLIASYVYIGPGNHGASDLSTPIMEQEMEHRGGVSIGENTWIGTKATILDGVTIGRDAIIGAHSLVRDNVPDRAIVAGTPAKIIRYRE